MAVKTLQITGSAGIVKDKGIAWCGAPQNRDVKTEVNVNRMAIPVAIVGNDFVIKRQSRPQNIKVSEPKAEMKVEASAPAVTISPQEVLSKPTNDAGDVNDTPTPKPRNHKSLSHNNPLDFFHRHTVIVVAVALLIIGGAAIKLGANYYTAQHIQLQSISSTPAKAGVKPVSGYNLTVPAADFQAKLQSIVGQPASLTVGSFSEPVKSDTIKSWLQITANKDKSEYYIHVKESAIGDSLIKEANTYAKTPVNQLTVTEDGNSRVVVAGKDGRALSDPNGLKTQAHEVAKNVLAGKGLQFNTPLAAVPFQSVTPAAYNKLIVADVTTKKMWAFQNGNQVNSWLISAGKPSTPTPLGQFKVYAKFTVQDMRGTNPDGTPYFQPHVRWISYFYQGSAVHGVYWRPSSWFGVNNSSHGCIGLPENQAKWVYDWAPVGTPVIVHS